MKQFKGSKLLFIKYLLPVIVCIGALILLSYFANENSIIINYTWAIIFLTFLFIVLIISLIYAVSIQLILYPDKIYYQYGFFFKSKNEISLLNIRNISYKKSFLDILFHRVLIQIEIQNVSKENFRNINIYLSYKEWLDFKNFLIKKANLPENIFTSVVHGNDIIFNKNELFLKSLSVVSKFIGLIIFIFLIFTFINSYRTLVSLSSYLKWFIVIILISIIAYFIVTLYFLAKFHNYTIINNNDRIVFSYGLFEKRYYTILKKDINAVIVKQRLIDRILKKGAIKLDCSGMKLISDEQIKQSYLIPYCDISFLEILKEKLNLNLIYEPINMYRPTRFTYTNFVLLYPLFKLLLSYLILMVLGLNTFLLSYTIISLLYIVFIFEGFDKLSNQQIFFNEKIIIIDTGQLIKYRFYIHVNSVQKIIKKQNILKKLQKVSSLTVDYDSIFFKKAKCFNLDDDIYEKLSDVLLNRDTNKTLYK